MEGAREMGAHCRSSLKAWMRALVSWARGEKSRRVWGGERDGEEEEEREREAVEDVIVGVVSSRSGDDRVILFIDSWNLEITSEFVNQDSKCNWNLIQTGTKLTKKLFDQITTNLLITVLNIWVVCWSFLGQFRLNLHCNRVARRLETKYRSKLQALVLANSTSTAYHML